MNKYILKSVLFLTVSGLSAANAKQQILSKTLQSTCIDNIMEDRSCTTYEDSKTRMSVGKCILRYTIVNKYRLIVLLENGKTVTTDYDETQPSAATILGTSEHSWYDAKVNAEKKQRDLAKRSKAELCS